MRVSATFTGSDGSLGYVRGRRYTLTLRSLFYSDALEIVSPVMCPYANLTAFLRNWQSVTLVGDP